MSFDDGSSEIPGAVAGPVERVLVIGAGIAGLAVANALTRAGVGCVVLEGRDRVGGRLHTVDIAGSRVDLGGSWMHHPEGNPISRLASLLGIESSPADPLPTLSGFDCATGEWLPQADLEVSVVAFTEELPALRERLGSTASAADGMAAYLATTGLSGDRLRRAGQEIRAHVEADAAGAAEHQSLAWLWTQAEYGGSYFGDVPVGGYAAVAEGLAAGLEVRQQWPVAGVELTATGVIVRSESGDTEAGSHVVVTVPLGVLKRNLPSFTPALPPQRVDAIHRLGFGRYEKVLLAFREPFWRGLGWSHLVLFPARPAEPAYWVFDLDAFGSGPVLACHVFHSGTDHVVGVSAESAAGWVTGMLSAAMGEPCPEPVAVTVTGWAEDRFTGGTYTQVPPGSSNADLDLLGQPVAGRLLFAGEHTQSARLGYADGALASGIREAKRLLGTPAVRLGRVAWGH